MASIPLPFLPGLRQIFHTVPCRPCALSNDIVFTSCINWSIFPPASSRSFNKFLRYSCTSFINAVHTLVDKYSHELVCGFVLRASAMRSSSDDVRFLLTILSCASLTQPTCLNQRSFATCCTNTWLSSTPGLNFSKFQPQDFIKHHTEWAVLLKLLDVV